MISYFFTILHLQFMQNLHEFSTQCMKNSLFVALLKDLVTDQSNYNYFQISIESVHI